jgi:hypothetical protein
MKKISRITCISALTLAVATGLLVAAPSVFAASNHGISGTVYSPCSGHTWYISSNPRTKSGTGPIKAQFSDINPGGLKWKLLNASNVQIGSQKYWTKNETGIWRTFTSSYGNGKVFYNAFAEYDGQCGYADYDFTGTEYY